MQVTMYCSVPGQHFLQKESKEAGIELQHTLCCPSHLIFHHYLGIQPGQLLNLLPHLYSLFHPEPPSTKEVKKLNWEE